MRPRDTSREADEVQLCGYRGMSAAEKAEIVAELSEGVRVLTLEGIRQRHPNYDDDDVRKAMVALLYGREAARHIWPDEEPREP